MLCVSKMSYLRFAGLRRAVFFGAALRAGFRLAAVFFAVLRVVLRVAALRVVVLRVAALRVAGFRFAGAAFFRPKARHFALIDARDLRRVLATSVAVLVLYSFLSLEISAADQALAPLRTARFFGAALRVAGLRFGAALRLVGLRLAAAFLFVAVFLVLRIVRLL